MLIVSTCDFFFFKQKTAYEMRISDWSSDVCSSDLTTALEANLLSGNVDMIAGELGLTLDQARAFEKRHGEDYQVIYEPSLLYEHIDLMLDNPIMQDKRVRQALVYAIDRETINQRLFEGRQTVAHSDVSPLDWVYNEDVKKYPYDPAKAAELLDAAGWSELRGGIRHNAKGEPLQLEFMTTAGRERKSTSLNSSHSWAPR